MRRRAGVPADGLAAARGPSNAAVQFNLGIALCEAGDLGGGELAQFAALAIDPKLL